MQIHPRTLRNWPCAIKRVGASMKWATNRCIARLIIQASVSSIINHRLFTRVLWQRNLPLTEPGRHMVSGIGIGWRIKMSRGRENTVSESENISERVCSCGPGNFTSWQCPDLLPVWAFKSSEYKPVLLRDSVIAGGTSLLCQVPLDLVSYLWGTSMPPQQRVFYRVLSWSRVWLLA